MYSFSARGPPGQGLGSPDAFFAGLCGGGCWLKAAGPPPRGVPLSCWLSSQCSVWSRGKCPCERAGWNLECVLYPSLEVARSNSCSILFLRNKSQGLAYKERATGETAGMFENLHRYALPRMSLWNHPTENPETLKQKKAVSSAPAAEGKGKGSLFSFSLHPWGLVWEVVAGEGGVAGRRGKGQLL